MDIARQTGLGLRASVGHEGRRCRDALEGIGDIPWDLGGAEAQMSWQRLGRQYHPSDWHPHSISSQPASMA